MIARSHSCNDGLKTKKSKGGIVCVSKWHTSKVCDGLRCKRPPFILSNILVE